MLSTMQNQQYEYILNVWTEKPEDISNVPDGYWRAHITEAPRIPEIGEAIESSSFDAFTRYRVFDVRHSIGGGLSELVIEGRSELKESKTPEGTEGLVRVLAYVE